MPPELADFGFLIVAIRPDLIGPSDSFRQKVSDFAAAVRSAQPVPGGPAVRMPFDRSRRDRQNRLAENIIEVPDILYDKLVNL